MKKTLITLVSLFFTLSIFAQKNEEGDTLFFGSDDSDKAFAITIESMRPKGMKRFNARIGSEMSYKTSFVSLSYMVPSKHYFELSAGAGAGAMGTYIFHTKEDYKVTTQSLEISGGMKYVAKIPIIKQKNFGVRYGLGLFHMNMDSFFARKDSRIVTTRVPLTIGISRFNVKHGNYTIYGDSNIEKKRRRGHSLFSLNLDAVIFPLYFHKLNDGYTIIQDENAELAQNELYQSTYDEHVDVTEDPFGLHASLEGIITLFSRGGSLGFKYQLGAIYYPNSLRTPLEPSVSLGLVWFFNGIAL